MPKEKEPSLFQGLVAGLVLLAEVQSASESDPKKQLKNDPGLKMLAKMVGLEEEAPAQVQDFGPPPPGTTPPGRWKWN